jgi:hypothetical protein
MRQWIARSIIVICLAWVVFDAIRSGQPLLILIYLCSSAFFFAVMVPPASKRVLVAAMAGDVVPVRARLDDYPQFDRAQMEEKTRELEALGFSQLGDFSLQGKSVKNVSIFARLLVNADGDCFAEVHQQAVAKLLPVTVTLFSFFGEGPPVGAVAPHPIGAPLPSPSSDESPPVEGWSYATINVKSSVILRMLRHPRGLSRRMLGATPEQLLRQHLADREKIAARLQLPITQGLNFQRYFNWSVLLRRLYRYQLRRMNSYVAFFRALFANRNEWWGALKQLD